MQFGHYLKVHAIDAGDQGERGKDAGEDGQGLHHLVHAIAHTGAVGLGNGITLTAKQFTVFEQHFHHLRHLLEAQQRLLTQQILVLAQQHLDLMAQWPHLAADGAQIAAKPENYIQ